MDIIEGIIAIRKKKGFTQSLMAEKLGIAPNNYGKIEKRLTELTVSRLNQVAEILSVSVVELLTGEPQTVKNEERIKELEEENKQLNEWLYNSADRQIRTQILIEEAFRYFLRQYEVATNVEDSPLLAYYQLDIHHRITLPETPFFLDFVKVNRVFLISFISINCLDGEFEEVIRLIYEKMKPYSIEEEQLLREYEMQLKVKNKKNALTKPKG